jgi:hypothetical protein
MGDRCYFEAEVLVNSKAVQDILDLFGFDNAEREGKVALLEDCYMNYGGQELLDKLQGVKATFIGSHDAGGDYCGSTFACIDGNYREVKSWNGTIFCSCNNETGVPIVEEREHIKKFIRVRNKAREALSG